MSAAAPRSDAPVRTHSVIVYSDDPKIRDAVRTAVGRRPAADLGRVEWAESTTGDHLVGLVDKGGVDLVILDGEAWPTGGLGLARQLKDELADSPPTLVLIARRDDRWLAKWSMADAVLPLPIDAPALAEAVAGLLRQRESRLPVRRAGR
ncbi:MAG: putative two-component system response regulator [Frankiales bacterium]|nr:putative two-component system response regulator [Frankiales bacterium]